MNLDSAHVSAWIGGVLAVGFGAADLFHFHALASTADVMFITGGLAAFGVSVAYAVGVAKTP